MQVASLVRATFGVGATPATLASGYDGVQLGRIHGWAFDPAHPTARLVMEVVSPSGARVSAVADRYRADVHKSGLGDGYCGFAIPLDRLGDAAGLRIFCRHPRMELARSAPPATGNRPVLVQRRSYVLHLDNRPPGTPLTGWAVDWDCPDRRRLLQLQSGGGTVIRQRATLFRGDLRNSRSDGYLGFALPSPGGNRATITDLGNGISVRVTP